MQTMRAAVLEAYGQPLRLVTFPVPNPGAGEILSKLTVSGVRYSDVHIWQGETLPTPPPEPCVLSRDGVGIVAAAMVSDPEPLVQEWLTWAGIAGTSVGTRTQRCRLMDLHAATPLRSELELIPLHAISGALTTLSRGRAKGRFCVDY